MNQSPSQTSTPPPSLGRRVHDRRRELGLQQAELAELAGVSVRFLHSLEHDKPSVRLDKLLDVLDVLGLEFNVRLRQ